MTNDVIEEVVCHACANATHVVAHVCPTSEFVLSSNLFSYLGIMSTFPGVAISYLVFIFTLYYMKVKDANESAKDKEEACSPHWAKCDRDEKEKLRKAVRDVMNPFETNYCWFRRSFWTLVCLVVLGLTVICVGLFLHGEPMSKTIKVDIFKMYPMFRYISCGYIVLVLGLICTNASNISKLFNAYDKILKMPDDIKQRVAKMTNIPDPSSALKNVESSAS
jgi:hypothetical protein